MAKPPFKGKKATSATSNNLKATASSAEDIFDPENPVKDPHIKATAHKLAHLFYRIWATAGEYSDPGMDYYE
ncbi:hypothetical protein [Nostoc sp.]|uniref:hypothetical protein n=1 Tax=Nostoc sp. TaxID=1180 RepID=UPI002FFB47D3